MVDAITAFAVPGLPEFGPGDDVGARVAIACARASIELRDTDVVVVASKVVAKAEDRFVPADRREQALAAETVRQVAARWVPDADRATRVVQTRSGPVLVAAGIDSSDVPNGPDGQERVLLLPADPDASARRIRAALAGATAARPGVLVTDTAGRPWRQGVCDFALGAAGLAVLDDRRGTLDHHGRPLTVTVRAVADELAALADLVKGKAAGTPVAVVRGLDGAVLPDDGPGARGLVRSGPTDWFAHGADEAVRAALGLRQGPDGEDVRPAPLAPPDGRITPQALDTATALAFAGPRARYDVDVERLPGALVLHGDPFARGIVAERLAAALHTVRLGAVITDEGRRTVVTVVSREDASATSSADRNGA